MRRASGFQQQTYVKHQECWHSTNDHHNHVSGLQVMPTPSVDSSHLLNHLMMFDGSHTLHQDGWHGKNIIRNDWPSGTRGTSGYYSHVVSGGEALPADFVDSSQFSSQISKFNKATRNGEREYETSYEVHVPVAVQRIHKVTYEHSSWSSNGDHFNGAKRMGWATPGF